MNYPPTITPSIVAGVPAHVWIPWFEQFEKDYPRPRDTGSALRVANMACWAAMGHPNANRDIAATEHFSKTQEHAWLRYRYACWREFKKQYQQKVQQFRITLSGQKALSDLVEALAANGIELTAIESWEPNK